MPRRRSQLRYTLGVRQDWLCYWCKRPVHETCDQHDPARATLDHLRAKSLGGTYALSNLVVACPACNLARGAASGAHVPPPMQPAPPAVRRSPLRDACIVCGTRVTDASLYCPLHRG